MGTAGDTTAFTEASCPPKLYYHTPKLCRTITDRAYSMIQHQDKQKKCTYAACARCAPEYITAVMIGRTTYQQAAKQTPNGSSVFSTAKIGHDGN